MIKMTQGNTQANLQKVKTLGTTLCDLRRVLYIPFKVNDVSTVKIISYMRFDKIQESRRQVLLEMGQTLRLADAYPLVGNGFPCLGFEIAGLLVKHEAVVALKELGMDFMEECRCVLDLEQSRLRCLITDEGRDDH